MTSVLIMERQARGRTARELRNGRFADFFVRLRRRLARWRTGFARFRSESEIRRKLVYVDDHLLRDIGLVRTNGRIESIDIQRCLGYRQDL